MTRRGTVLPRDAYAVDAATLARDLLGCVLRVDTPAGTRRGRIVETEAYLGERDAACHASRGRTPRTESLYGPPGSAYVYLVYGIHHLFNVVAAAVDEPHAVLVRALEPLDGWSARTHGPGLLTKALGIDRRVDRVDLTTGPIVLERGDAPRRIETGARIGVAYAGDWAGAPLRFGDADSPALSKPFRPRATRPR